MNQTLRYFDYSANKKTTPPKQTARGAFLIVCSLLIAGCQPSQLESHSLEEQSKGLQKTASSQLTWGQIAKSESDNQSGILGKKYSREKEVVADLAKPSVPSIAPLANKIPVSKIDPTALDRKLIKSILDQYNIADHLSAKYNSDMEDVREYVANAVDASAETLLDPLLLVAVMAVESNFKPNLESSAGAQGLMQVMTKIHARKYAPYGGKTAAFQPEANIRVGALILKQCIALMGSLEGGLRYYVGAASPNTSDGGFVAKVLNERRQLIGLLERNVLLSQRNDS
jgi:soluble lytic murein transglycosylase-like protein